MSRPKGLPKTTNYADDFDFSTSHAKSSADVDIVRPNNFFDNQNFNNPSKISGSDYKNADYMTTNGNKYQYDFEARPVGDYNINHNKNYVTNTSQADIDFQKPKSYQNRLVTEAIGYADDLPVPKTTSSTGKNILYIDNGGSNEGGSTINGNTRTVWTGNDKYVPELANAIEERLPGKVKAVERKIYDGDNKPITDLDIELDNIVIQVKSGNAKKLTAQMVKTEKATGKTVISFTPDIKQSAAVLRSVREKNFKTFTTIDEILEFLEDFYKNN